MAKGLYIGDIHWSEFSSLLRRMGTDFSMRLENLINSVNWVEETAEKMGVDYIIYHGDFFDKPEINANEIKALNHIWWAHGIEHYFIVGNHESPMMDLKSSSTHLFNMIPNCKVFNIATKLNIKGDEFLFLPYTKDENKQNLESYGCNKDTIVISHNDIKGIQYGPIISKNGFNIDDIENNCKIFFNGHIHNGSKFCKNGYNLGNLTGQNFSEDAFKYKHNIVVYDTITNNIEYVENPYAFNFYILEVNRVEDLEETLLYRMSNVVMTVKCPENIVNDIKQIIDKIPGHVKESRVIAIFDNSQNINNGINSDEVKELQCVNHIDQFIQYIRENCEMSQAMVEELEEVCK